MSVLVDGREKRLGLALSGGGFRAAAFHLGVFRKLAEMQLLDKVDVLSCVSGGSIAGAYLGANWGQSDVLDRLDKFLSTKSIAVSAVLAGALDPFATRLEKLARSYDRHLFSGKTLASLSHGPRIYLNATNLSTGNMFFFVAGENKPPEVGEWELGIEEAPEIPLSRAVAASSAFPPVFPPLVLDSDEYSSEEVDYVSLTDGGVYDNLGINPLLRERNNLDYVIASDAGKPFAIEQQPTTSGAAVLSGALGILMEQVRGLQMKRMELTYRADAKPRPIWFSIDSEEGESVAGDAAFASSISTNLKRLSSAEMAVLERHGGALFEARVERYLPELIC